MNRSARQGFTEQEHNEAKTHNKDVMQTPQQTAN